MIRALSTSDVEAACEAFNNHPRHDGTTSVWPDDYTKQERYDMRRAMAAAIRAALANVGAAK